ncbi:hypothetical protein PRIPAC_76299 [Pristionchus pacificus]|uniref:BZIP domain-containing protein n=1 Tax=Pristionchus pacificus TaxID=54126 RepID=A0A2A6CF74_PRIPA|nr:hypothetical protein PRIPAC_76299 [Pristionchus pacificus]|eukprot:PDM76750.1 hypothetical protein PRIPAC_42145 [Pristionchus pacificus]
MKRRILQPDSPIKRPIDAFVGVNRTRQKKKQEEMDISTKVKTLRVENSALERKVESLQKELSFLKEKHTAYAKKENGTGSSQQQHPNGGAPGTISTNPFSSL